MVSVTTGGTAVIAIGVMGLTDGRVMESTLVVVEVSATRAASGAGGRATLTSDDGTAAGVNDGTAADGEDGTATDVDDGTAADVDDGTAADVEDGTAADVEDGTAADVDDGRRSATIGMATSIVGGVVASSGEYISVSTAIASTVGEGMTLAFGGAKLADGVGVA